MKSSDQKREKRNAPDETEKKTKRETKAETQKGRIKEKGEILGSVNIESTLNAAIHDGTQRLCANGFKFIFPPILYSNAILSSPFH